MRALNIQQEKINKKAASRRKNAKKLLQFISLILGILWGGGARVQTAKNQEFRQSRINKNKKF